MTNSDKLIGIGKNTKNKLDKLKNHPRETYNDVICELITMKMKKIKTMEKDNERIFK